MSSHARSRVAFARLSDAPPPAREMLAVAADGSWTAWRSIGAAIGRFAGAAGTGAADAGERIVELAEAAAAAEPPRAGELPPDATVDSLEVAGRSATIGSRDEPEGPWGALFAACRGLIEAATDHPAAAIALVIAGPDRVRLEQRGAGALTVELGEAPVQGAVWTPAGEFVATGTGRLPAGRVEAGPGWSLDVALEGIDAATEGQLVVSVSFVADDGGVYIPVTLAAGQVPG